MFTLPMGEVVIYYISEMSPYNYTLNPSTHIN